MIRSEPVIHTALLIGGVRHTKGETLVPVMPCSIWEDALSDSRMALQHHVATSVSLVRHWNTRQKVLSRVVETVERREHRSPSTRARAVFNFDRQSWMDDGWRGGRGGIFPDYWGVVKRRTAAD